MNKSVLISIRPRWIVKIARGEKTIEVRKTRPKLNPPFKCYIYCTKAQNPVLVALQNLEDSPVIMTCGTGTRRYPVEDATWARLLNGTVCGEFTCDSIETHDLPYPAYQSEVPSALLENACLSYTDLHRYIGSGGRFYGWHISNLKIYDEPKGLSSFASPDLISAWEEYAACEERFGTLMDVVPPDQFHYRIKRPPQSWFYVV